MGIRQLQTFMQKHVPSGFIDVSIRQICEDFTQQKNERPVIAIDLMGFISWVLDDVIEMLAGGRHNIYYEIFEDLFSKMADCADLIFFEDGPIMSQKMTTWYKRQNERYDRCIQVLEIIYKQSPLFLIPCNVENVPTISTSCAIVEFMAEKYGKRITTVTKECDAEIARFASLEPRTVAVLASDSDFLIFSGNWKYISINDLDRRTLMTKEYSRTALRDFLGLNDFELVLLGTLNGNDVIQYEEVRDFHRSLAGDNAWDCSVRFPLLAKYVKRNLPSAESQAELVTFITKKLFRNDNAPLQRKVVDSLNLFRLDFDILQYKNPLLRLCRDKSYNFVFCILKGFPRTFILTYVDLRVDDFPNYFKMVTKLFRKQAGIVLKSDGRYVKCEIVSKMSHEIPYKKYFVDPTLPPFERLPPLLELLQRDKFPNHDRIRFKLVKWTISETNKRIRNYDLLKIPQNYLHDILLLTFFVSEGVLEVAEADIILLSVKKVETNDMPRSLIPPRIVNMRAFRIAFIYARYYEYIKHSLEVVGLKELRKVINFDGVLFNTLYLYYQENYFNARELLGEVAKYRLYA